MKELKETLALLRGFSLPEDAFGVHKGSENFVYMQAQKRFRAFAKVVHPDRYQGQGEKKIATEAFGILGALWAAAETRISQGIYGKRNVKPKEEAGGLVRFRTKRYAYVVAERIREGGTCGIFDGSVQTAKGETSRVILKVPHSPKDNDLMEREAKALGLMDKKLKVLAGAPGGKEAALKFAVRIPRLVESVKIEEPGKKEGKVINAFLRIPCLEKGWFTLEEIRKHHPDGIDPRAMCFIWNRLFEGLTLAHLSGIAHCAITPNHVLVQAKEHVGCLIDWTASCELGSGETPPYVDDRYLAYFPEEILQKGTPSPSSDIYMSAWCMAYLLGGDPKEKTIPAGVPTPIRDFLNLCLQPKRGRRPQTAEQAYSEFRRITKAVYGPRKFVELEMPAA